MTQARHILYLHSHDTGRYVSPYGHALATPNLQAFAERGVTFRNAFCANPTCSPSRACLLTGQYAHSNGMMGLVHRGGRLKHPDQTLPAYLRQQNYDTVIAGLQHVAPLKGDVTMHDYGYTHELFRQRDGSGDLEATDRATVRVATEFLASRREDDRPFFLDVGFFATHRTPAPYGEDAWHNGDASPLGDPRFVTSPPCLPDTPETRRDFADYAESVRRLDGYYGSVLEALDAAGLRDQTLVLITTDHGIAFPKMKCNLTAHGTGVLMLMAGPTATGDRSFTGGRVLDGLVSHVDWFPTVCDVLRLEPPAWLQGQSTLPMVDAEQDNAPGRDAVFSEVNYHAAFEPMRSVRTTEFNYIRRIEPATHAIRPNIDDSVTKRWLHEHGRLNDPPPQEALFDLQADPNEACNVIADPRLADAAKAMRDRLDAWMRETDDPACAGSPRVAGMLVNPADGYSPGTREAVIDEG
ncbi:MAG: sulfatase [Planctomycetota bacterium]